MEKQKQHSDGEYLQPRRKTKILFLLYDFGSGGAQKVLADLVNNIDPEKFDITVKTLMGGGAFFGKLQPGIHHSSIIQAKHPLIRKLLSGLFQYVIPPSIQYRFFYKGGYDYEVAFMEGYPTKILAASDHPDKYAWVHIDVRKYHEHDRLFGSFANQQRAYRRFKRIFCVSDDVRDAFTKRFSLSENVYVVRNIFDDAAIRRQGEEQNPYHGKKFQMVWVGNLIPRKRADRLVELASELRKRAPEFPFEIHIVGDGPEKERLLSMIEANHLADTVLLEGFRYNPYPYIRHADLFVCASEVEGYSTVVAEAFILGVPVLVTESAGMEKLLGGKPCGVMVPQQDAAKRMAEAVLSTDWNAYRKEAVIRGKDFSAREGMRKIERLFST